MSKESKKKRKEQGKEKGECGQKDQVNQTNETLNKEQDQNPEAHTGIKNQQNQSNQMSGGKITLSEDCIKNLIRNLIWKKTGKIFGYLLLMILFLAISLLLTGVLICLHTRLALSEVPFVILLCAVLFVFFAIIVWLTKKMSTIIQQYQTAINRLVILQTRLELGTKEHEKEALISHELKMIMLILGKYWDANSL